MTPTFLTDIHGDEGPLDVQFENIYAETRATFDFYFGQGTNSLTSVSSKLNATPRSFVEVEALKRKDSREKVEHILNSSYSSFREKARKKASLFTEGADEFIDELIRERMRSLIMEHMLLNEDLGGMTIGFMLEVALTGTNLDPSSSVDSIVEAYIDYRIRVDKDTQEFALDTMTRFTKEIKSIQESLKYRNWTSREEAYNHVYKSIKNFIYGLYGAERRIALDYLRELYPDVAYKMSKVSQAFGEPYRDGELDLLIIQHFTTDIFQENYNGKEQLKQNVVEA